MKQFIANLDELLTVITKHWLVIFASIGYPTGLALLVALVLRG